MSQLKPRQTPYQAALQAVDVDPIERLKAVFHAHRDTVHARPNTYILAYTMTDPELRTNPEELEQPAIFSMSGIFTWFYNHTASLPVVILLHSVNNTFDDIFENIFPNLLDLEWEIPNIGEILLVG